MKIFLIGLPGSGKTTLGEQLASALGVPFADLDQEIEKFEGKAVTEIFAQQGEESFRKIESVCLSSFIQSNDNFVMATGGGTPVFFENMDLMNKAGQTVFLDIPLKEIADRLQKTDLSKRPLFAGVEANDVIHRLEKLLADRSRFYSKSQIHLAKADLAVSDLLNAVKA